MGRPLDEQELRRRAIEGVRAEVEAFGSAASDSRVVRLDGVVAAVVPAAPERSVFNSVFYDTPSALAGAVDELEESYRAHGVRAWTVWVPDDDHDSAQLLAARGHALDAAPRAMAMLLDALCDELPPPPGIEPGPIDQAACAALNDRAFGYGEHGFRAGLGGETVIRWHGAFAGGEPAGCVGTIATGEDCCVTGVATSPEYGRRGIATWLMCRALAEARAEGQGSASLQATRAGAPVYERLGFRDLGFIEMWEMRS